MRNCLLAVFFLSVISSLVLAQAPNKAVPVPPKPTATPAVPSFDITAMDKTIDPCVDFFKYACGGWMVKNPIPPDQSRWGRFDELQERNRDVLHDILEKASAPDPKRSAVL
ncbi:MAG TPA: M13 family metallopeptidase N-terminal domain-containing protein, partial [Terriglobales bacterium]|nr:M13 family metallopeptidase N-terminal domain-containing protein [Terriglobales bacterium]